MKIMTKSIIGLAVAAATLMGVSACGNDSSSSSASSENKDVTLTVWAPQEDQATKTSWLQTEEAAFQKANPNYKITWKNAVVSEADAAKTVAQNPKAAADVYMFANDQLGTLISSGAIGELGTDAAKQVKADDDPSMVQSVTGTDGKLYGVPFTGNTWFMYYNKSKFNSSDIKSLDKMLEKGKVSFPVTNSWNLPAFYMGDGATLFGKNGTTKKDGMKGWNADVTKYIIKMTQNKNFVLDADGSGLAGLKSGAVDVYFSGTWDADNVKKALGSNYGAAELPSYTLDGKEVPLKAFAGSKAIAYNPNSKASEAAAKFAAFLGSKSAQEAHFKMRGIVPTVTALKDDSAVKADPAAIAQIDTISDRSVMQPTIGAMNNFWTPCQTFGSAIISKTVNDSNAEAKTTAWVDGFNSSLK